MSRASIRRPLVGAFLADGATTALTQPGPRIAPAQFLSDEPFVRRCIVGADEQVGIVVTVDEECIIAIGGRDKESADTAGEIGLRTRVVNADFKSGNRHDVARGSSAAVLDLGTAD